MARGLPPNTICRRCIPQGRQFSTSRTLNQSQHPPPPPAPPRAGYTRLTNRSLISISGLDSPSFLQGLTTQNVLASKNQSLPKSAFYTAFLNSQGRVLHDAFIYPYQPTDNSSSSASATSDPAYLIEIDKSEVKNLLKHFRKHKLRSKLTYRALDEDERSVWALWDENKTANWNKYLAGRDEHGIACVDHRAPGLGYRLISPGSELHGLKDSSFPGDEAGLSTYKLRRILHGVPEGQGEIVRESSLPMDSNMDAMGGIDFHKGCYLGQELTIRTHHRGVIRKRILPVQLSGMDQSLPSSAGEEGGACYSPGETLTLPPTGANISKISARRGRSAGKFVTGVGNVGLAMCRLEVMTDIALTGESTQYDPEEEFKISWDEDAETGVQAGEVKVKAFVPPWLREYIASGGARHRVSRSEGQRAKDMVEQLEEEERQERSEK